MPTIELSKIIIKDSKEEVSFSYGEIFISTDGFNESWEVELSNVENGKPLERDMRARKQPTLILLDEYGKEYEGKVLVTNYESGSSGTHVELLGSGKLKRY